MAINSINSYPSTTSAVSSSSASQTKESETSKNTSTAADSTGVVYEKGSADASTQKTENKKTNSALVAKLKADSENRVAQLRDIVTKMMTKQGATIGTADDMWRFLAGGNFTVSAAAKAQAQADIADDGYWGVEKTSDRIVDFAKALSGDDPEQADKMLEAVKKGFKLATKSWGREMPDITKRTNDAVVEKFDKWKNGDKTEETAATEDNK